MGGWGQSVLNSEVSSFQRLLSTQMWHLRQIKVSCLLRCPEFRGVLIEIVTCVGTPGQRQAKLFTKLCGLKDGFQILYRCLRESQNDHMGHRSAADVLETRGR